MALAYTNEDGVEYNHWKLATFKNIDQNHLASLASVGLKCQKNGRGVLFKRSTGSSKSSDEFTNWTAGGPPLQEDETCTKFDAEHIAGTYIDEKITLGEWTGQTCDIHNSCYACMTVSEGGKGKGGSKAIRRKTRY